MGKVRLELGLGLGMIKYELGIAIPHVVPYEDLPLTTASPSADDSVFAP